MINSKIIKSGLKHLVAKDPIFSEISAQVGEIIFTPRTLDFHSFASIIINQQISGKASATILERIKIKLNNPLRLNAADFLELSAERIYSCGLSKQKYSYISDIAKIFQNNTNFGYDIALLGSQACRTELMKLRGIGGWSADIIRLFYIGDSDVFPENDVSLQKMFDIFYKSKQVTIEEAIENWTPYRSIVALYFWRYLDDGFLKKTTDFRF